MMPDQSLRITRLSLENWRNFRRVDVELAGRTFLVGPNASGKSNFLDAIRFLRALVDVGGGFQQAVSERNGVSTLRCLAARRQSDIALSVELGTDDAPGKWQYAIAFNQKRGHDPALISERVSRDGVVVIDRPDKLDEKDAARLTQTYLEQVHANVEFRAISDFFKSVRYLHIVPQLVREPDRSVGRTNDPFGGDFLEQIANTPKKTREARFRKIVRALRIAVPQLKELVLDGDVRGPHLRGRYEHWRPQGAWQTEADFSDGTLRLLGLLWSALDGEGPLLLEEPELSLHPGVVRYVPLMLSQMQRRARRQIVVSTHSGDLLEDEGLGLDEVLMLVPASEGTTVHAAREEAEVADLLAGGLSMAEAVMPRTQPRDASQLALFPFD